MPYYVMLDLETVNFTVYSEYLVIKSSELKSQLLAFNEFLYTVKCLNVVFFQDPWTPDSAADTRYADWLIQKCAQKYRTDNTTEKEYNCTSK